MFMFAIETSDRTLHTLYFLFFIGTNSEPRHVNIRGRSQELQKKHNTFPGGFKAVIDVYPLDVISKCGVWQKGSVPVDCVQSKFEGQLLCTRRTVLNRLEYPPC